MYWSLLLLFSASPHRVSLCFPREGGGHGGHERQGERREAFKMPAGKPLSMGTLGDVFAKAEEQRKKR